MRLEAALDRFGLEAPPKGISTGRAARPTANLVVPTEHGRAVVAPILALAVGPRPGVPAGCLARLECWTRFLLLLQGADRR